ncbi:flagellar biosynthesis protein FlhA [Lysobacter enzymogenes]|uniref:flagellar biosynthesis protein FlhA n=1 Tax=Lysobacter enzymogenes TaxID=69 RepID=UPI00374A6E86
MTALTSKTWLGKLGRHADLALVGAVLGILLILFIPIPPALLDLLILVNFAFALSILLMTFYVARPVDFSTFPSLLLIATLFRLALNIAATRLIMSGADAGNVIHSIGDFVVRGNYVIGLIVFFILIVVQYVVVTAGAQRVSEVAARFVLDAMPGQQMSIDADLNMGLIDQDEAKRRRKELEKEAGFYGSMDGASKFVKGDAIAGIVILLINIFGGWAVGVAQMGMQWHDALRTFTLLTIGDGIVTQVPALVISVATGIIVTRSSSDNELSAEVVRQMVRFPKIQLMVVLALIGLLLLPGMPKWPLPILAVVALAIWLLLRKIQRAAKSEPAAEAEDAPADAAAAGAVAPIEIAFGPALAAAWLPMRSVLTDRIASFRKHYSKDMGVSVPAVTFREEAMPGAEDYRIYLFGDRYADATVHADKTLAIHASDKAGKLAGVATKDPAFGLPAVWIDNEQAAQARQLGYTPIDPVTVLTTHAIEVIKANIASLLTRAETMAMLESVRARQPGLVEELVPNVLAVSDVQHVLQGLLEENVSIRNIDLIVEVLADSGRHEKDPARLVEAIRRRLGHGICRALQGERDTLSVLTLDPAVENRMLQSLAQAGDASHGFVLDPRLAESFLARLLKLNEAMMRKNLSPALLCRPEIRRALRQFSRRVAPRLAVLSMSEIPHSISLTSFGTVGAELPPAPADAPAPAAPVAFKPVAA